MLQTEYLCVIKRKHRTTLETFQNGFKVSLELVLIHDRKCDLVNNLEKEVDHKPRVMTCKDWPRVQIIMILYLALAFAKQTITSS